MFYQKLIAEILDRAGMPHDPIRIEEIMRDELRTLDHLSRREFTREVKKAAKVLDECHIVFGRA